MELFFINLKWMIFNCMLAGIPVILAILVFKKPFTLLRFIGALVWLAFLPNSFYLVTDIVNIIKDVNYITGIYLIADFAMYVILIPIGVITFVLALEPFEKMFGSKIPIFVLNFLIAFGIILGRFLRVNSWEVITNPQNVIVKSAWIVMSIELLLLVLALAILCQLAYFMFRDKVLRTFK